MNKSAKVVLKLRDRKIGRLGRSRGGRSNHREECSNPERLQQFDPNFTCFAGVNVIRTSLGVEAQAFLFVRSI